MAAFYGGGAERSMGFTELWKLFLFTHNNNNNNDLDVDGRIILRWVFGKWEGLETGWSWLRIGTDGGHL